MSTLYRDAVSVFDIVHNFKSTGQTLVAGPCIVVTIMRLPRDHALQYRNNSTFNSGVCVNRYGALLVSSGGSWSARAIPPTITLLGRLDLTQTGHERL